MKQKKLEGSSEQIKSKKYEHISWHLCSFYFFPLNWGHFFKAPFWSRSSHVGYHGSCGKRGAKCGRSCERREGNRHCGKQRCQVWFFGRDELWLPRIFQGLPRIFQGFPRVPNISQGFPTFPKGLPRLPGFTKDTHLVAVGMDGWVEKMGGKWRDQMIPGTLGNDL